MAISSRFNRSLEVKPTVIGQSRHVVERNRLTDRLGRTDTHRLFVNAPTGYGKTIFLASWLNHFAAGQVWLALREDHNDLGRFLNHLASAISISDSRVDWTNIASSFNDGFRDLDTIIPALASHLNRLGRPLRLVIDDYHAIHEPMVHRAFGRLLQELPNSVEIALASRRPLPPSVAVHFEQEGATSLDADDLRFTVDESVQFFNEVMQLALPAENIALLHDILEGWPAAFTQTANVLQKTRNRQQFIQRFSEESGCIMEPLLDAALAEIDSDLRAFLMEISILENFNADLCDAVTDRTDSAKTLDTLKSLQMIVANPARGQGWYRNRKLFSNLLRSRLTHKVPDLCSQLHSRAARWHANHKQYAEALHYAAKEKDFELIADIVETHRSGIFAHGHMEPAQSYVRMLPKTLIYRRLRLSLIAGWGAHFRGEPLHMEQYIVAVENGIRAASQDGELNHEHQGMLGQISLLRACQTRYAGNFEHSIRHSSDAMAILSHGRTLYRAAELNIGICYLHQGKLAEAEHLFLKDANISVRKSDFLLPVLNIAGLARIRVIRGSLDAAHDICATALEQLRQRDSLDSPASGVLQMVMAEVAYERNDLDRANELLHRASGLLAAGGLEHFKALSEALLARIKIARGEANPLFQPQWEETILRYVEKPAYEVVHFLTHLALAWLAQGRNDSVLLVLGQAHKYAVAPEHEPTHLIFARLLIAQKRYREALDLLGQLKQQALNLGRRRSLAEILMLSAIAREGTGQRGLAFICLQQSLSLGEAIGCLRLFLDERSKLEVLMHNLRTKIQTPYLDRILEQTRQRDLPVDNSVVLASLLSAKEYEVAKYLASGLSNQEIAETMFVSLNTVKTHIRNVFRKLNVKNRLQAADQIWRFDNH